MVNKQFYITTLEELKCITDQLRLDITMLLIEKEMTVTDIAKALKIPKAKIFYHMKELEKFNMITQSRQEVIGSNVHKFYKATHQGFMVDDNLWNHHKEELDDSTKQIIKKQLLRTSEVLYSYGTINNRKEIISSTRQIRMDAEHFADFKSEFETLMTKYNNQSDSDGVFYYFNMTAFPISEQVFKQE